MFRIYEYHQVPVILMFIVLIPCFVASQNNESVNLESFYINLHDGDQIFEDSIELTNIANRMNIIYSFDFRMLGQILEFFNEKQPNIYVSLNLWNSIDLFLSKEEAIYSESIDQIYKNSLITNFTNILYSTIQNTNFDYLNLLLTNSTIKNLIDQENIIVGRILNSKQTGIFGVVGYKNGQKLRISYLNSNSILDIESGIFFSLNLDFETGFFFNYSLPDYVNYKYQILSTKNFHNLSSKQIYSNYFISLWGVENIEINFLFKNKKANNSCQHWDYEINDWNQKNCYEHENINDITWCKCSSSEALVSLLQKDITTTIANTTQIVNSKIFTTKPNQTTSTSTKKSTSTSSTNTLTILTTTSKSTSSSSTSTSTSTSTQTSSTSTSSSSTTTLTSSTLTSTSTSTSTTTLTSSTSTSSSSTSTTTLTSSTSTSTSTSTTILTSSILTTTQTSSTSTTSQSSLTLTSTSTLTTPLTSLIQTSSTSSSTYLTPSLTTTPKTSSLTPIPSFTEFNSISDTVLNETQEIKSEKLLNISNRIVSSYTLADFQGYTENLRDFAILSEIRLITAINLIGFCNNILKFDLNLKNSFARNIPQLNVRVESFQSKLEIMNTFLDSVEKIFLKTNLNNQNQLVCSDRRLVQCGGITAENIAYGSVKNFNSILDHVNGALIFRKSDSNLSISFVDRELEASIRSRSYFLNVTNFVNGFYIEYDQMRSESISFVTMKDGSYQKLTSFKLDAYLLSITLGRSNISKILVNLFYNKTRTSNSNDCKFWNMELKTWSSNGCLKKNLNSPDINWCQCNHTTFFGLIGSPENVTKDLSTVYTILSAISIFFATIVIIRATIKAFNLKKENLTVKKPAYYTLLSTIFSSVSYKIATIIMIIIVYVKYTSYDHSCAILAFFQHFTILVYFFSLFVIILMHYFSVTFKLTRFYLFKWFFGVSLIIPFLIALVLLIVNFSAPSANVYVIKNSICFLDTGYTIGFIMAPICLIVVINLVIIVMIIRAKIIKYDDDILYNSTNGLSQTKADVLTILGCLLFSGITWVILPIGLIHQQDFANGVIYFLSILNAMQGIFLFVHFFVTYQVILGQSRFSFVRNIFHFGSDDSEDSDDEYSKTKEN
ncbi:unnamed protein product [Brachionus calyciflorus]|uniref:G-protein coupled receptors family 2 profile 2 domain-containing protein n=1 Tax=Brachionus calyciflorus TaxID=104777 RepID=A0A813MLA5_9BILA|nr:unnamed protein product [Brachionus calyciflorus]